MFVCFVAIVDLKVTIYTYVVHVHVVHNLNYCLRKTHRQDMALPLTGDFIEADFLIIL